MSEVSSILSVKELGVRFDNDAILKSISFDVQAGDVLAIVGPNGAGKSVLFRSLLGLIPYSGEINWREDAKVSYVPQKFQVDKDFPLTVKEFLEFKSKSRKAIMAALHSVGITDEHHITHHILNQRLGWLSGGQTQRILIAWALLDEPDVLLFDEPTSGIDVGGEETIYNLIKKLHDEKHITILIISHDLNVVYKYATSVLCLNKDMICYGAPADALDPAALKALYGEATFFTHHHHAKEEHPKESHKHR